MSETPKSGNAAMKASDTAVRTARDSIWKASLRRLPGVTALHRRYLNVREQYLFLSRIARERYGGPQSLFDDYQDDYSHHVAPEQERYKLVIGAVRRMGGHWGDAMEIGCSKGLFTVTLAGMCASVLACDISPRACILAAARCSQLPNVTVRSLDIQRDPIIGEYDLVFAMDTLVYVHGRRRLEFVIGQLARSLRPGGMLVFSDVCWPPSIENAWWQKWLPEGADHHIRLISARSGLRLVYRQSHQDNSDPGYLYMDHLIAIFAKS